MDTIKKLLKIGMAMVVINLVLAYFSPLAALIMLWGTLVPFGCVIQLKNEGKRT